MAESIAVVIIIIFLLVIGIVFWSGVRKDDVKNTQLEYQDLSVIELAKIAAELPELRCYNTNVVTKVNCFDWYKILAMNKSMNDPVIKNEIFDYYNYYFKNSKITIQQIYPNETTVVIYDNNISKKTTLQISIPIIIEKNYGREGRKGFGLLIVEGYYR
jgi:type II secretory pathway pseudopilin PulG